MDLPWDKDGKNGEGDVQNSLTVLMDWWTTEGNYNRFRGKNNRGGEEGYCQKDCM